MPRKSIFLTAATILAIAAQELNPWWGKKLALGATGAYCQFTPEEVNAKEQLLKSSLEDGLAAEREYQGIIARHREMLRQCRRQNWAKEQAVWLRLYPCDVSPGSIDYVLDRIVNLGYNRIHLEVFYDSQVLLPPNDNPTPWNSVVRSPGAENVDLLQQTIDKAHERGIKVYAWLFTLNFGYVYAQNPDKQDALARNGEGINSLTFVHDRSQAFVDPYSQEAQQDYARLVTAIMQRQPDGILFDYVRYPRGTGKNSSVHNVRDLWIYGKSSLNTLYNRAKNPKGRAALERYITTGNFTANDLAALDREYSTKEQANWQGRRFNANAKLSFQARLNYLKADLWFFAVAHAAQGVIDFLSLAARPAQNRGLPAGAVFFPDANRLVGKTGFDSRLQAWDKFPTSLEWHPMAYSVCDGTHCIADEVQTVVKTAPPGTKVVPALAGAWGKIYRDHPTLEEQMEEIRVSAPEVDSVSHFAYSWLEPELDNQRQACNLQ